MDDDVLKKVAEKIGMETEELEAVAEDLRTETDVVYKFLRERAVKVGLTMLLAAVGQTVTSFIEFGTHDHKACVSLMNSFADLIKNHAKVIEEKGEAEFNARRAAEGYPVERKH